MGCLTGFRICRVCVIFTIPPEARPIMIKKDVIIPEHLAYVEWYTPFTAVPEANHLMFKVVPATAGSGDYLSSIIPVANICRSIHLFPKFGPVAPQEWTSSSVLDHCKTFYVNSFTDKHLYRFLV